MREHERGRRLPEIIPCIDCGAVYGSLEGLGRHRADRHPSAHGSAHPRLKTYSPSGLKSSPEIKSQNSEGKSLGPKTHPRMDARMIGGYLVKGPAYRRVQR